jgi:hypothetical protein
MDGVGFLACFKKIPRPLVLVDLLRLRTFALHGLSLAVCEDCFVCSFFVSLVLLLDAQSSMRTTRHLQNITIIDEDEGSSIAPTRSPVASVPRPTTLRVCAPAASDADTVEVTYRYEVEIDAFSETTDLTWSVSFSSKEYCFFVYSRRGSNLTHSLSLTRLFVVFRKRQIFLRGSMERRWTFWRHNCVPTATIHRT